MRKKDIEMLSPYEKLEAINYAWVTYTLRRVDLPHKKKGKGKGNDGIPEVISFDHPYDWDKDPTYDPNFVSIIPKRGDKNS